jgi:ribonucleoside-diphosphate reductase alpha chain
VQKSKVGNILYRIEKYFYTAIKSYDGAMISKIKKRDGRSVDFDPEKITNAIFKAAQSVGGEDRARAEFLSRQVVELLEKQLKPGEVPTVEQVQDLVEKVLVENKHYKTAKAYILYRQKRAEARRIKAMLGIEDELKLPTNALLILAARYLRRDVNGNILESTSQLFRRVARATAEVEKKYGKSEEEVKKLEEDFYQMMARLEFLPNSPTLMNAGIEDGLNLSACFVIPVEDSIESIFDAIKIMAIVQKAGGGCVDGRAKLVFENDGEFHVLSMRRFYEKYRHKEFYDGEFNRNGIDVRDKQIYVFSFDPKTKELARGKVQFIWKYVLDNGEEKYEIKTNKGTKILTSAWHPFLVMTPDFEVVQKGADEIKKGDMILGAIPPKVNTSFDFDYWMTGFIVGDGSIGKYRNRAAGYETDRLRIYDNCKETLEKINNHLEKKFRRRYSIQKDRNIFYIDIKNKEIISCCLKLRETVYKNKNATLSFITGLFDAEGHVSSKPRVELSMIDEEQIEAITYFLNSIGIKARMRKKKRKDGVDYVLEVEEYSSLLRFYELIGMNLQRNDKREKLKTLLENHKGGSFGLPLNFESFKKLLSRFGVGFKTNGNQTIAVVDGEKISLGQWHKRGVVAKATLVKFLRKIGNVLNLNQLEKLLRLIESLEVVKSISRTKEDKIFYDLTVENFQNYLAGANGLVFVHNTGFSFSRLRPKGDIVKSTAGTASGPISFMKVFNAATEEIKQGGKRRGANMGMLRVDHPDILDFIVCKEQEGFLRNFNISVAITDKFMDAVKHDKDFNLINPRNKAVAKTLKARAIWNLIVTMAWKNGEPGVVFIDRINKHCNSTPHLGEIESTNPCVIGNTYVFTEDGWEKAKYLKEGCKIWTPDGWAFVQNVIDNGIKEVAKVELTNGMEIVATYDHKFLTQEGWKSVKELNHNDKIKIVYNFPEDYGLVFDNRKAEWLGYWVGDGDITTSDHVSLYVGNDEKLTNYFLPVTQQIAGNCSLISANNQLRVDVHRKDFANLLRKITGVKLSSDSNKKTVPEIILKSDSTAQRSFLRGLFSADGSVYDSNGTPTISLSSTSKELLNQVQLLLLSQGIPSTLTKEKMAGSKNFNEKTYRTLPTFRILISGERAWRFYKKIGLLGDKTQKLETLLKDKKFYSTPHKYEFIKIKRIEPAGKDRVFDVKAPPTYTWVTNGVLSLDCGEQPLLPYESCNLGSINLSKMLKKVDGKYAIDWDKLSETVRKAVRFLDNVIDANKYPVKQIEEMTKGNRKIGLGVMGFADMLILLGAPYNSEEALSVARNVMKFVTEEARKVSVELGKEKGNFPNFKGSRWDKLGFEFMRNASVSTIAPTGSISEIAGCSQGIEPLFAIGYIRNVAESLGTNLIVVNPYFERIAVEEGFYDEKIIKAAMSSTSVQHIKEIPEDIRKIFVTAHDILPEWHVKVQAAFQQFVDNSISKTINFPHEATPDDVEKVFMLAYDLGCLGITVYRHGSREQEVLKPVGEAISACEACELN